MPAETLILLMVVVPGLRSSMCHWAIPQAIIGAELRVWAIFAIRRRVATLPLRLDLPKVRRRLVDSVVP